MQTYVLAGCRHEEDVRRQQKIASEVKGSLDAQVAAVRERQLAEAQQDKLEVQRMQQHWAQLQVWQGVWTQPCKDCTTAKYSPCCGCTQSSQ